MVPLAPVLQTIANLGIPTCLVPKPSSIHRIFLSIALIFGGETVAL